MLRERLRELNAIINERELSFEDEWEAVVEDYYERRSMVMSVCNKCEQEAADAEELIRFRKFREVVSRSYVATLNKINEIRAKRDARIAALRAKLAALDKSIAEINARNATGDEKHEARMAVFDETTAALEVDVARVQAENAKYDGQLH